MEKQQIRLDSPEEECIDLSISRTPASELYLLIGVGLNALAADLKGGQRHINSLRTVIANGSMNSAQLKEMIKETEEKIEMGKGVHETGLRFYNELARVIQELDSPEKKKSVIIKPNWMGG